MINIVDTMQSYQLNSPQKRKVQYIRKQSKLLLFNVYNDITNRLVNNPHYCSPVICQEHRWLEDYGNSEDPPFHVNIESRLDPQ